MACTQELFNLMAEEVKKTHCISCTDFDPETLSPRFECIKCLSEKVRELIDCDNTQNNANGETRELEKGYQSKPRER